jgi:hypothetical protein
MQALLLVVEQDGPAMFIRIGVMKALNRHVERVFNLSRNDKRWGRRKLKRTDERVITIAEVISREVANGSTIDRRRTCGK